MRRMQLLLVLGMTVLLLMAPVNVSSQQSTPGLSSRDSLSTPVGEQMSWLLDEVRAGGNQLTPDAIAGHFTPEFLTQVPPEYIVAFAQELSVSLGDFTLDGFTRPPTDVQANALLTAGNGIPWVMQIAVEPASPHLITALNYNPAPVPAGVDVVPAVDTAGTPTRDVPRIDGLFDVGGGRQIYLSCVGTGSPTIILESGLGDPAAPWFGIESALSGTARVCSYDRPGTVGGASDPVEGARTGADMVTDLHAVLQEAGVEGPYVLVGHSIGGIIVRLYAHAYPDDVVGLVLVDSSHEDQDVRLEEIVDPGLWSQYEAVINQGPVTEGLDITATLDQARDARADTPLLSVPLVVVGAGLPSDASQYPPGWPIEEQDALWQELQADLATLAPGGELVISERSGHYVHLSDPELVVSAIQQVVASVRVPAGPASPEAATPAS